MSKVYDQRFKYRKKFKPNVSRSKGAEKSAKEKDDLYSKNWENIRKLVYRRDGNRCVLCGQKGKLHAHHLVPVRISHDNSISNLVSVCEKCHRRLETIGFAILEQGGSRADVRKAELTLIMEEKKKRYERYLKKLNEKKESENNKSGEQDERRTEQNTN